MCLTVLQHRLHCFSFGAGKQVFKYNSVMVQAPPAAPTVTGSDKIPEPRRPVSWKISPHPSHLERVFSNHPNTRSTCVTVAVRVGDTPTSPSLPKATSAFAVASSNRVRTARMSCTSRRPASAGKTSTRTLLRSTFDPTVSRTTFNQHSAQPRELEQCSACIFNQDNIAGKRNNTCKRHGMTASF